MFTSMLDFSTFTSVYMYVRSCMHAHMCTECLMATPGLLTFLFADDESYDAVRTLPDCQDLPQRSVVLVGAAVMELRLNYHSRDICIYGYYIYIYTHRPKSAVS